MSGIYHMQLHDDIIEDGIRIIRVPGGWLYIPGTSGATGIFVPYNNEFATQV